MSGLLRDTPFAVRKILPLLCLGLVTGLTGCEEDPPPPPATFEPPPIVVDPKPPPKPVCDTSLEIDPGPTLVRRLSRIEYDHTLRDLFGDGMGLAAEFSPEERMLGFDNNARALQVSAIHAEEFMGAAEVMGTVTQDHMEMMLPCDPEVLGERQCALAFIDTFGLRAWRRPLEAEELDRLAVAYDAARLMEDATFEDGVSLMVEALLQSPHFLYRIEVGVPVAERPGIVALTSYEVASRLSYFLWRSMPDDLLLDAAAQDALQTPDEIGAQADRMLQDPRAREGLWSFFEQWLRIAEVRDLSRDDRDFPNFEQIRELLYTESQRFIEDVVFEEGSDMRDLFRAPFTYLNGPLAEFYGIEGVQGPDFRRVEVDPARHAGILSHGSVMAVTSKARITSPIHRGIFVREQLFCMALPPPPPLPVMAPDPADDLSTRDKFEIHTSNPACAGCHSLIDQLGFTFEHYDMAGRWRDVDNGYPVDASALLNATWDMDGPVSGAVEMGAMMAESEHAQFCVATQVFRYAFGRGESQVDACALNSIYDAYAASDYNAHALFSAVTRTEAFRLRRAQPDESPPEQAR